MDTNTNKFWQNLKRLPEWNIKSWNDHFFNGNTVIDKIKPDLNIFFCFFEDDYKAKIKDVTDSSGIFFKEKKMFLLYGGFLFLIKS